MVTENVTDDVSLDEPHWNFPVDDLCWFASPGHEEVEEDDYDSMMCGLVGKCCF